MKCGERLIRENKSCRNISLMLCLNIRKVMNISNSKFINFSVSVWVGYISLFRIASYDGFVMATYLTQIFDKNAPKKKKTIRASVIETKEERTHLYLITTAITLLALLSISTLIGQDIDFLIPINITYYGGIITLFVMPFLYNWNEGISLKRINNEN